ncbi:hypothetical protein DUI87_28631 [Hirundo rustica rustica]|uniref:CCHC-type domain-containing protein n=1 Tax=Hirundo rustica rustica TaxID=333673 RepID=A0A3M0J1T4_HIRRU|nr:hypothetical protein DUI87_28631 [Hirundo rustica rustica]
MTEPQLGTQTMQREGGGWNVTATLTNTGQTENCFALAAASPLKSEDPPPPIPILEGPQNCSDDIQLTDWHEVTREICKEENLNPLAMPVIFSQQARGPRTWTAIPSHEIKELRKAIKDSGICSPYFKQLLKSTLEGHTLTPNDCKNLAGVILTDSQYMLWEFKWRRLLTNILQMHRQSTDVDLRTLTMSKLTGDPPDDQNDNQVNLPRTALDDIKKMACRAFVQIQPAGSFEKAYNIISQDSSEPFTTFVDRVIQAAERQCGDDIARPIVIWDIIENNASPECKRAIKALGKERPTVPEMIDACNQIGSPQHVAMIQANELGKTIREKIERALTVQAAQAETRDQKVTEILAALHLSSQEDNTMAVMQATVTSGPCYFCKRPGHILRNCPDIKRGVQAPDRCSTCFDNVAFDKYWPYDDHHISPIPSQNHQTYIDSSKADKSDLQELEILGSLTMSICYFFHFLRENGPHLNVTPYHPVYSNMTFWCNQAKLLIYDEPHSDRFNKLPIQFAKGIWLICGDRAWQGIPSKIDCGPCAMGQLTIIAPSVKKVVKKKSRRIRSSWGHQYESNCDSDFHPWNSGESIVASIFLPQLSSSIALKQLNKLGCWLSKEVNATSTMISDLLTDEEAIRHATLQNRAAIDCLLLAHGHGCEDFEGLCCMNLSDHSVSIHKQLQELRDLASQITIDDPSWLDNLFDGLSFVPWLKELCKIGLIILTVVVVVLVAVPCILQCVKKVMSKIVSSVLVVNKDGGDVGEDEAKKPYKYDCLDSENVKPVNEIELKGYRISQKKAQMVKQTVIYLGYEKFLKYQAIMVEQDDVEIVVTNTVNPASFLSGNMGEPVIHECLEAIKATCSSCLDLKDTLLENTETWSTDGSSCVISGRHAGYVVTMSREVIESGPLPTNTLAQKAEITALTRALELAKGKKVNIYTDLSLANPQDPFRTCLIGIPLQSPHEFKGYVKNETMLNFTVANATVWMSDFTVAQADGGWQCKIIEQLDDTLASPPEELDLLGSILFIMNWRMMKWLTRSMSIINAHNLADVLSPMDIPKAIDTRPCHELQPGSSEQGFISFTIKPNLLKPNFRDISSTFIYTILESSAARGEAISTLSFPKRKSSFREPPTHNLGQFCFDIQLLTFVNAAWPVTLGHQKYSLIQPPLPPGVLSTDSIDKLGSYIPKIHPQPKLLRHDTL